jgi:hypothetical protein
MEREREKVLIVSEGAKNDLEQEYDYYYEKYSLIAAEKLRLGFNQETLKILPNILSAASCLPKLKSTAISSGETT